MERSHGEEGAEGKYRKDNLSYKTSGHVYSSCVWSSMPVKQPLTKRNLQRLQQNDWAMIRQICSIKPEDVATVRSSELQAKLELEDLDLILRERRLRWFGHVEHSNGAVRTHVIYRLMAGLP